MAARRGYLKCALCALLPHNVGEIGDALRWRGKKGRTVKLEGSDKLLAAQMAHDIGDAFCGINGYPLGNRCLCRVLCGYKQLAPSRFCGGDGKRKCTRYGPQRAGERKLAYKAFVFHIRAFGYVARAAQYGNEDSTVKARTLLAHCRRGKVDGKQLFGEAVAAVLARGAYAVLCFLYRRIGKTDNVELLHFLLCAALNGHFKAVYAVQTCAVNGG